MNARIESLPSAQYLADTHEVSNLSSELWDSNMYTEDAALCEAVRREGAAWVTRTADAHVPASFCDSFLHRNAVNRDLLAAAARRLGPGLHA